MAHQPQERAVHVEEEEEEEILMDLGISPENLAEEIQVGLVQRAYRSTLEKQTGSVAGSLRPIEGEGLFTNVDIRQES
jgi:hypothetical protein